MSQKSEEKTNNPMNKQVGGKHYKSMPIQPIEIRHMLNLDGTQSDILTYVLRHKYKNGLEDLEKALHHCELVIHDNRFGICRDKELTTSESSIISVIVKINNMAEADGIFLMNVALQRYVWLKDYIKKLIEIEYKNQN